MASQAIHAGPTSGSGQQANISKQRRRFPTISDTSLTKVAEQYRFSRFNISPLSPQAFGPWHDRDNAVESSVSKETMMERYLVDDPKSSKGNKTNKSQLSLAASGLADALPTPGIAPNIWALLQSSPVEKALRDFRSQTVPQQSTLKRDVTGKPLPDLPDSRAFIRRRASTRHTRNSSLTKTPLISPEFPDAIKEQSVEIQRPWPRLMWSQDDSGLLTPPPPPLAKGWTYRTEFELPEFTLGIERSVFDPPPPPASSRFPEEFPASPRVSKPYPLDISRKMTKQVGSAMNSPIMPEDRQKAVLAAEKPPSAPITDKFPVELPQSPLRAGPSPINTMLASEKVISDESDLGSPTPTQPPRAPISRDFPQRYSRPAPLNVSNAKHVRFAVLKSPSMSDLRSPSYNDNIFKRKVATPSPPLDSPTTPEAMTFFDPRIVSPLSPPQTARDSWFKEKLDTIQPLQPRGRPVSRRGSAATRARTHSPPRSERPFRASHITILPRTKFDPLSKSVGGPGEKKLVWPATLPKIPYHVGEQLGDDRRNILQSYFNRGSS